MGKEKRLCFFDGSEVRGIEFQGTSPDDFGTCTIKGTEQQRELPSETTLNDYFAGVEKNLEALIASLQQKNIPETDKGYSAAILLYDRARMVRFFSEDTFRDFRGMQERKTQLMSAQILSEADFQGIWQEIGGESKKEAFESAVGNYLLVARQCSLKAEVDASLAVPKMGAFEGRLLGEKARQRVLAEVRNQKSEAMKKSFKTVFDALREFWNTLQQARVMMEAKATKNLQDQPVNSSESLRTFMERSSLVTQNIPVQFAEFVGGYREVLKVYAGVARKEPPLDSSLQTQDEYTQATLDFFHGQLGQDPSVLQRVSENSNKAIEDLSKNLQVYFSTTENLFDGNIITALENIISKTTNWSDQTYQNIIRNHAVFGILPEQFFIPETEEFGKLPSVLAKFKDFSAQHGSMLQSLEERSRKLVNQQYLEGVNDNQFADEMRTFTKDFDAFMKAYAQLFQDLGDLTGKHAEIKAAYSEIISNILIGGGIAIISLIFLRSFGKKIITNPWVLAVIATLSLSGDTPVSQRGRYIPPSSAQ